jgi:hypothetical protein
MHIYTDMTHAFNAQDEREKLQGKWLRGLSLMGSNQVRRAWVDAKVDTSACVRAKGPSAFGFQRSCPS